MNDIELEAVFAGKTVLVTGHTGFKGSWLTAWLSAMGANVVGVSLEPEAGDDVLFQRANIKEMCAEHHILDIRDGDSVIEIFSQSKPEIVLHLAAQALVRRSYSDPVGTFSTNVMGTVNLMEAARHTPSVRSLVCVTTDKVYDNREWCWPYREVDRLGGKDAYSASKAAAEIAASVYMGVLRPDDRTYVAATARGGNVVGGGDWAEDRIVPDIIRAIRSNETLVLRNPGAIRPWQHVLELCYGYLILAARLYGGWSDREATPESFLGAWNFGPSSEHELTVGNLVDLILEEWGRPEHPKEVRPSSLHEATYLRLDSSKAIAQLGWAPQLDARETIRWTATWYKNYLDNPATAAEIMLEQIRQYTSRIGSAHK